LLWYAIGTVDQLRGIHGF